VAIYGFESSALEALKLLIQADQRVSVA